MNSQFKAKFLQNLTAKKKGNKGFTLIELLVVVIIIGVLAAIALPNLLSQVAKGRQAEAKTNLGAINRAQQTYRLEKSTFGALANLPIKVGNATNVAQYYTFAGGGVNANGAAHTAAPNTTYTNDIKSYASAVGQQNDGTYSAIVCEQISNPSAATDANAVAGTDVAPAACGSQGEPVN